jgi:hypothetical protein
MYALASPRMKYVKAGSAPCRGSSRSIEQACCGVTQPVQIKALQPRPSGCRPSRLRRQNGVPVAEEKRRSGQSHFPCFCRPRICTAIGESGTTRGSVWSWKCRICPSIPSAERITFPRSDRRHTSAERASPNPQTSQDNQGCNRTGWFRQLFEQRLQIIESHYAWLL